MTLAAARIYRDRLPLAVPFVTALRRVDHVEFIVLELRTDTGLTSLGSAPATEAITGETLQSIETALHRDILPLLTGRPFSLDEMLRDIAAAVAGNSSAKAAADMALYMLAAQEATLPLYRLLGEKEALPIKTAVTVSLDTPDNMLHRAKKLVSDGFDILKIKVGADDGRDIVRIRTLAEALPATELIVDANQAWCVKEALGILERCQGLKLALIEQPVAAADSKGLETVTKHSPFPVLADEAVFCADDARRVLEREAADLINIKLMKSGGIAGALEIIDVCRSYGKQCMLGSMLEGPVSITAALHLAAACPETFAWFDLDSPLLYRTLPADLPFEVKANRYAL